MPVQQVTWGGLRVPSFLWRLPVPFILGPVGGGETAPSLLRDVLSPRNRLVERVRDLSNATLMFNPPMRLMLNAAKVIAAQDPGERRLSSRHVCSRRPFIDIGIGVSRRTDQVVPRSNVGIATDCSLSDGCSIGRALIWRWRLSSR